jgi:hypothetical protein
MRHTILEALYTTFYVNIYISMICFNRKTALFKLYCVSFVSFIIDNMYDKKQTRPGQYKLKKLMMQNIAHIRTG